MGVGDDFKRFKDRYDIGIDKIQSIAQRYQRITRQLNRDFWAIDDPTRHSLYVGSYGRDTAADGISDLDIGFLLPSELYHQYHGRAGNGQSQLLQAIRKSVQQTYPRTTIGGSGQVVCVTFQDRITFEILPAFENTDKSWTYACAKNGGTWKQCNPRAEIAAIHNRNIETNRNLKQLCRMMRVWKENCQVPISGMLIDTLAYQFIDTYAYPEKSFLYHQYMVRDFFHFLAEQDPKQTYWRAPGSLSQVKKTGVFQHKAKVAFRQADLAIEKHEDKFEWARRQAWRQIFGSRYPGKSYRMI